MVEADIDDPTDADLLERSVRKLGGLVRRIKAHGAATRTWFRDRRRAAGRRLRQLAYSLRRRGGQAMAEVDRLTGEVARIAKQTVRQVRAVGRNARWARGRRPQDGRLAWLVGELDELGVVRVGLQRKGRLTPPEPRWSGPGRFAGCATGGSASRPGSAISSVALGCGAPGCAVAVARIWVGLGVFVYNLQRMTVVVAG